MLSNCPILEELSLIQCGGLKSEALCIPNFALKNLHIRSCYFGESTLKIYAPNLMNISYEGELPANFVFGSFLSLVEADIDVHNYGEISAKTVVLIKLFELLSKVKILKMSGHSFLVLSQVDILLTDLPAFNNLIHLEVSSEFDWERVGSDPVSTLRILFRFLQLSPNLETIVFATNIYCCSNGEDEGCWSLEPKCSLLHLRSVKFSCFYGIPEELDAIKLFLTCAGVLETLTIVASPHLSRNYEEQTKVMRQLLTFSKPINCVINFLPSSENI
ncbi:hypothetical protein MKW92_012694 [Papaver armeniacum]|nr:hypothetical protein MKW92_012694 [Papaver armeniacum]